jgi:hypothetical protein
MLVSFTMKRASGLSGFLVCLAIVAACEGRLEPGIGTIGSPPITITAADFGNLGLVEVNDTTLPRSTSNSGVVYTLVSGSFSLHADSTWLASTLESLSAPNGTFIGTSPANYTGTWRVHDTTLTLLPNYGTAVIKGDTIFWRNGPRHTWEDSIKFTLVRK